MASAKWGSGDFWGISSDLDPHWVLTDKQKKLRDDLIELCRITIRPHAIECDRNYTFPTKSLNALADLGLLGLIIPKRLGGLGENHVCVAMVVETLSRYGCASLAMVYSMHTCSVAALLFRHHSSPHIKDLLSRINKDKLVGTISYSDPATGGHFWYHLTSKSKMLDDGNIKLLQYCSWATSAGFADFYIVGTTSPDFSGDFSNMTNFLVYKDEVRANTDDWSSLGLHANQSGPLVIEGVFKPERMIGPMGDGIKSNCSRGPVVNFLLLGWSACWNGVSMGCMDIAKKHVTRKAHADVGLRICDYPSIQDYFGEYIGRTGVSRGHVYFIAQQLDRVTNNNDWDLHKNLDLLPRTPYAVFLQQARLVAATNVLKVSDAMMAACGGTGYKTELGLERLLRDSRAGALMSPSNEMLRQHLGKLVLLGSQSIDPWQKRCDKRVLHHELDKMSLTEKQTLMQKLQNEFESSKHPSDKHSYQDTDFENPFNTAPPQPIESIKNEDGTCIHKPALCVEKWTKCTLDSVENLAEKISLFNFNYTDSANHSGCHIGNFIQMRINAEGRYHERYLSPTSNPTDFGRIQFLMKFESSGIVSNAFKALKKGTEVEFRGPCGGLEYLPNTVEELTLLVSGTGVAPAIQIIRSSMHNPADKTVLKLVYYAENAEELVFRNELDQLKAKSERLRTFYSVGEVPENWDGFEGFIDTQMIDKFVSKPNGQKHKIVLCGGATMAVSCLHSLKSLSFPSEMIFIYGQFGTEQVRAVYGKMAKLADHRT